VPANLGRTTGREHRAILGATRKGPPFTKTFGTNEAARRSDRVLASTKWRGVASNLHQGFVLQLRYVTATRGASSLNYLWHRTSSSAHRMMRLLLVTRCTRAGSKHYSVHRIENSPWLQELENMNSAHPRHDRARFLEDKIHYVITFKEGTFECIARESAESKARIEIYDSEDSAMESWRARVGA